MEKMRDKQWALVKALLSSSLAVGKFIFAKMFGYIPAIMASLGPLALAAIAAYGFAAAIDGTRKATKQSGADCGIECGIGGHG